MKQHWLSARHPGGLLRLVGASCAQAREIPQKTPGRRPVLVCVPAGARRRAAVSDTAAAAGGHAARTPTPSGIFYGYGYAVAQDRLFQMEMARRSTQGRVAEVLGQPMVAFDKSIRGNFSPERIQRQLAALPASERQILDGYAAGMNAWIARVRAEPGSLMPANSNDLRFQPDGLRTAYDVAMVLVGTHGPTALRRQQRDRQSGELPTALKDQARR